MLEITIPAQELWDEVNEVFINTKETKLRLEHSLISLSKWESETHRPFINQSDRTIQELIDYIRCMVVGTPPDQEVFLYLPDTVINQVAAYIDDPMTATWFSEDDSKDEIPPVITSELIYSWMIAYNVSHPYEKWHLNRLLTLIRILKIQNQPKKERSQAEIIAEHRKTNQYWRAKLAEQKNKL